MSPNHRATSGQSIHSEHPMSVGRSVGRSDHPGNANWWVASTMHTPSAKINVDFSSILDRTFAKRHTNLTRNPASYTTSRPRQQEIATDPLWETYNASRSCRVAVGGGVKSRIRGAADVRCRNGPADGCPTVAVRGDRQIGAR